MLMRSITAADDRTRPIENLATNPRFKRAVAGTGFTRRNLATYPRFHKAVAGSTVVRRNLATNPVPVASTDNYAPAGAIMALDAVPEELGASGAPARFAGRRASGPNQFEHVSYRMSGLVVGRTYTASFWGFSTVPGATFRLRVAANSSLSPYISSGGVIGSQMTRVVITFTATAEVMYVGMKNSTPPTDTGAWGMTGVLVEERPALLPYFDGSTTDDSGIVYEWEGAANASPSVAKAAVVEVRRNVAADPSCTVDARWAVDPGLVKTPTARGMQVDVPAGTSPATSRIYTTGSSSVPALPDTPLSARITIEVPEGFPAMSFAIARRIYDGDGANNQVTSEQVTVQPGTSADIVVESASTYPAIGAGSGQVLVWPGALNSDKARRYIIRNLCAERSPRVGPYFDGSATPDADLTPAWTGTENASASVLYGVLPRPFYSGGMNSGAGIRSWLGELNGFGKLRVLGKTALGARGYAENGSVTLTAGKMYTVAVRRYSDAAVVAGSGRIAVRLWGSASSTISYATPATAAGEVLEQRLTFIVPQDISSNPTIRFEGGYVSDGAIWFSDLIVTEGVYNGPFFDGDTDPDDSGIVYSWDGAPHASTSKMQAGAVEVRRNYYSRDPGARAGTTGVSAWTGSVDSATIAVADAAWSASGKAARLSWATRTTSSGNIGPLPTALNDARAAGTGRLTVVWRIRVSHESASAVSYSIANSSGFTVVARSQLPTKFQPGTTYELWWTVDAPSPFVGNDQIRVNPILPAVDGAWIEASMFDAYPGDYVAQPYFDGSTGSPDGDLVAEWVGAENASASVLKGVGIDGSTAPSGRSVVRGHKDGRPQLRIIPQGNGSGGAQVSSVMASIPTGHTVTVLGKTTGPARSNPLQLGLSNPWASSGPVAAGTDQIARAIGTMPEVASGTASVRLGGSNTEDCWWSELLVIDGAYYGPYFDGDDPRVVWRGTPHASTSAGYPALA